MAITFPVEWLSSPATWGPWGIQPSFTAPTLFTLQGEPEVISSCKVSLRVFSHPSRWAWGFFLNLQSAPEVFSTCKVSLRFFSPCKVNWRFYFYLTLQGDIEVFSHPARLAWGFLTLQGKFKVFLTMQGKLEVLSHPAGWAWGFYSPCKVSWRLFFWKFLVFSSFFFFLIFVPCSAFFVWNFCFIFLGGGQMQGPCLTEARIWASLLVRYTDCTVCT